MAENRVIIEFVGDVSGLKPAIDTLSQLGDLSEEQVNAFKKANAEFSKSTKAASDTEKSVSKLATSFKQVSGAIAGKAISEPLNQMAKATQDATTKTLSLKGELRALKEELAGLDEGTDEFEKLAFRAAQLEDQIEDVNQRVRVLASDTFKFDAAVDAIRGVTAAFSVAQGAAALFGEENEDLQKALLRVQGATALLTGVQEIANQVTGQGAAKLAILSAAQKAYSFVVGTSTGALKAFRIALASTGIGLIVIAAAALAANFEQVKNKVLETFPALEGLGERFTQAKAIFVGFLGGVFTGLKQIVKGYIEAYKAIGNVITGNFDEAKNNFNKIVGIATGFGEEVSKAYTNAYINSLKNSSEKIVTEVKKTNEKAIKQTVVDVKELAKEITQTLEEELGSVSVFDILAKDLDDESKKKALQNKIAKTLQDVYNNIPEEIIEGETDVPLTFKVRLKTDPEFKADWERELKQLILDTAEIASNSIFEILSNNRQAQFEEEQAQLEQRRERELANKNLTESQKASIEKKFQQQQAAIKQRQFQAEKQAAIAQATINGALAITKIFATLGGALNPAAIASIALTTVATAAQIAVISSQKAPKFAKGGWVGGKPHSQGGTLIEAEKDEFVVRKSAAQTNKNFLEAFNKTGNVPKALDLVGFMPQIRDNDMIVIENKTNIDYSKLGRAVAREISKLPQSELEVNYRGLLQSINSQQSLIEWQKRKYN